MYDNANGTANWREQQLYGSSRLGMWRPNVNLAVANGSSVWNSYGLKFFELSNHLGNVMAVISDNRVQNGSHYEPVVVNANDYYAFGGQMAGRGYDLNNAVYRYGFGGQEKSLEIDPNGNLYTAEFWEYDSRIARRWNTDPVVDPSQSPYAAFNNNPIAFNDPSGDCPDCPDPVQSKYLGFLSTSSSFANGIADGFIGALPEAGEFGWDMVTDSGARSEFMAGMKAMVADPLGAIKTFVGDKFDLYSSVLSGNSTEQQQYEVGRDIGNILFGVATGAAASKLTEVIKVAKFEKKLVQIAEASDAATGTGKATVRGTKIHSKFEKAVGKDKAEVSYKGGQEAARRGEKGSVRADAIYGSKKKPKIAYDLKTGKTGMSGSDVGKYNDNLPKGTKVKEISKGSNGKYRVVKK